MSLLEIVGVITGIVSVWLTTRERVSCWPVGIVSVVVYVVVFYRARLYGAMGLQVIYVALLAYGWYAWTHGGQSQSTLRVTRCSRWTLLVSGLVGVAATAALAVWLAQRTDEALPVSDAATTVFSLIGQWMQTRKLYENWHVWMAVDAVYVVMNISQSLYWTAGLYVVYVALAVAGLREWRQSWEHA
jgi:nicotinamide mononucleotide transporter